MHRSGKHIKRFIKIKSLINLSYQKNYIICSSLVDKNPLLEVKTAMTRALQNVFASNVHYIFHDQWPEFSQE
jgi:hypothetical protein